MRPPPDKSKRKIAIISIASILFVVAVITYQYLPFKWQPETIKASGLTWSLNNLTWENEASTWRVSTDVAYAAGYGTQKLDDGLLRSFCGAILTDLPAKPVETISRRSVSRVLLNVYDNDGKKFFDFPVEILVHSGQCAKEVKTTNPYTLAKKVGRLPLKMQSEYREKLKEWGFVDFKVRWGTGGAKVEAIFARKNGASLDSFPYFEACDLSLTWLPVDVKVAFKDVDLSDLKQIKVIIQNEKRAGVVSISKNRSADFSILDGRCQQLEKGVLP